MAEKIDGTGNAVINNIKFPQQTSHPASPASGYELLYIISGSAHGGLYVKDSGGRQIGPFITGSASSFTPAFGVVSITAGDYTTTSTTFADVDTSNVVVTITTGARRCRVGWSAVGGNASNNDSIVLDVTVDGTRIGQTLGLILHTVPTASNNQNVSGHVVTSVLSAGSHTFRLQYRSGSGGTAMLRASASVTPLIFWVEELNVSS